MKVINLMCKCIKLLFPLDRHIQGHSGFISV